MVGLRSLTLVGSCAMIFGLRPGVLDRADKVIV
jgi:hypothetical protein